MDQQDYWAGRTVFVTGATGMVGSWLVKELLARSARVIALVRDADPQSEFFRSGDFNRVSIATGCVEHYGTLARTFTQHQPEVIFHLAAQTTVGPAERYPLDTFESNVRGTYNLLEAARLQTESVRAVIVASSDKAYGAQPELPYVETMALHGRHVYEVSKSCADLLTQAYHCSFGLPTGTARCGNIFGGGDLNWSRIVPGAIRSLLAGERVLIRSDGSFVRDYLFVKDAVGAYLTLGQAVASGQATGDVFNFSCESPLSVIDVVRLLRRLMARDDIGWHIQNSAEREIPSQFLSAEKARTRLGWHPSYSLEAGLLETIEWYRTFLSE